MKELLNDNARIFFGRGKLRLIVLEALNKKPQIASFLAHELGKHREAISRVFLDLQKEGLAKCTNPQSSNFRYYSITPKGKRVYSSLIAIKKHPPKK